MRLIKVSAPEGKGDQVAKVAFSVEIDSVSRRVSETVRRDGSVEKREVIDIETSTPKAKRFVDALLSADFYNREEFTFNVRQPRTLISKTNLHELTKPFVEPASDVLEELWQFSHITASFVGRVLVASALIAYGMIEQKILLLIAGLLVLPMTPLLLAVAFGFRSGIWKLAAQGAIALLTVTLLLLLGSAAVAAFCEPPVKYNDFSTLLVGFLISVAVGTGAGLANIDDSGQRQLIGFAASAQIALVPVWFGVCMVLGFPQNESQSEIIRRASSFFVNIATMIVVPLIVYTLTDAASGSLKKIQTE
jgi:hypothetical protein